ncbi:DoxX family protein [Emticicia sp. CRIBPO]|uniref:DoxX family protein n=1 Tax=Emticicia sp. CRIBPO TaxID=2683258 RepID=UPI00286E3D68|nr:DoxX family protein [Emticicia sp. CRIBPO]
MENILKIINAILIIFAVYMGLRQGWAMASGKPEMLTMFGKWDIQKNGVMVLGGLTISGAVLTLIPQTFLWGNFITACGILFIMALHLTHKDLKGVAVELPFLFLSLVIIYLQHPLTRQS